MRTKIFLTGLTLLVLTLTGSAQSLKNGPGTGECDGTGPKFVLAIENAVSQLFDAFFGVATPAQTAEPGDGICDYDGICDCDGDCDDDGDCVCDQDCINDQDQILDQLQDYDMLQDKDQLKAKDGTCVNK